ncbi:hypothetical protein JAAARDRAFT_192185 [Jaapia argillacea MUCL 33604]|uniref:Uncharacterized protein n=1 Tax=Jaapia argillacea MUCL 33604 TaxID=933084 RepID=A0A067PYB3_9AGAM|nr:hypothetical protein JAAARDRAFT_192185 [Jaapia argillacea MUCL 33604]
MISLHRITCLSKLKDITNINVRPSCNSHGCLYNPWGIRSNIQHLLHPSLGLTLSGSPHRGVEQGHTDAGITKKEVNLVKGEKFTPAFLEINPKTTLLTPAKPTGEIPTSTATGTYYIITSSPSATRITPGTNIVQQVREGQYESKFASYAP